MEIENSILFLKIKKISSFDTFFRVLEQKDLLNYHYFHIYFTYYLFLVELGISEGIMSFCYNQLQILDELNRKQRKLWIITRISFIVCRNFRNGRRGKDYDVKDKFRSLLLETTKRNDSTKPKNRYCQISI